MPERKNIKKSKKIIIKILNSFIPLRSKRRALREKLISKDTLEIAKFNDLEYCKVHYKNFDIKDSRLPSLFKGLDESSASVLIKMINRILPSFSGEIQEDVEFAIDLWRRDYKDNSLKISDECYIYKNYILPIENFEAGVFFYKHSLGLCNNLGTLESKIIIDVGGYIGDSALMFSKHFPKAKIISFEATPESVEYFKKTIALNNLTNVDIIEYALGDKDETLYINKKSEGSNSIKTEKSEDAIPIKLTTLDNYVKNNNIKDIALIKVDIEGYEQKFIRGAVETIKKYRPILLLSIYHNTEDFLEIKPMIEKLNLNYSFKLFKGEEGGALRDILLICNPR